MSSIQFDAQQTATVLQSVSLRLSASQCSSEGVGQATAFAARSYWATAVSLPVLLLLFLSVCLQKTWGEAQLPGEYCNAGLQLYCTSGGPALAEFLIFNTASTWRQRKTSRQYRKLPPHQSNLQLGGCSALRSRNSCSSYP